MRTHTRTMITCATGVGLLTLFTAASDMKPPVAPGGQKAQRPWGKVVWPDPTKGIKVFSPPEDQVVRIDQSAFFTVVVEPEKTKEPQPLYYQWKKNGTNIAGATGPSHVIPHVQISDVGFYSCDVRVGNRKSSLRVVPCEEDSLGASLFVIVGTNTAVYGPFRPGTGTKSCVGPYTGRVTFKTAAGSTWFVPPAGKTNCTITDTTRGNYNPPYVPVVEAVENLTLKNWCGTNQVSFPVNSKCKYQFTTYIKNPLPPPNTGDPLGLDMTWAP